jgi:hypothetical protein
MIWPRRPGRRAGFGTGPLPARGGVPAHAQDRRARALVGCDPRQRRRDGPGAPRSRRDRRCPGCGPQLSGSGDGGAPALADRGVRERSAQQPLRPAGRPPDNGARPSEHRVPPRRRDAPGNGHRGWTGSGRRGRARGGAARTRRRPVGRAEPGRPRAGSRRTSLLGEPDEPDATGRILAAAVPLALDQSVDLTVSHADRDAIDRRTDTDCPGFGQCDGEPVTLP